MRSTISSPLRPGAGLGLIAALVLAAGCSDKASDSAAPSGPIASAPVVSVPAAPPAAAPAAAVTAPADAAPQAAAPATGTTPSNTAVRHVAVNVQGAAPAGLTVRVKAVEMAEDATLLTVSASFSSRFAHATTLAGTETFLRDAAGNQLMLKRPTGNQQLMIRSNDTMEGKLVFLGSVPADTKEITLVINQGNQPDDITGPGMTIKLPLSGA
ncbi:hypothetical protein [Xylophilus ampelinus]|uniref:Lipoprotein n=1 Tax=Xylophilus ampelinus TaxID=54067 RepID=A0A318SIW5_9BURK|nr:hypothetical protein [Xylophilus ampelinus]MCS4509696.1 hypothetical protein [Xylophilus ampelinus]PYE78818.1 hypothetical protein DFQ15_10410 [Xylophilus ampelinus]